MTKPKKLSREHVSGELKNLAIHMKEVADMLKTYGTENACQLISAATTVLNWAYAVLVDKK